LSNKDNINYFDALKMNFYSDTIMNDIIDNQPLDKITDLIQNFGEQCFNAIARYSYNSIHDK